MEVINLKNIKWIFVLYALATTICIMGIGVAIGARSVFGAIISILLVILVMGYGFKTKKKMREAGKL